MLTLECLPNDFQPDPADEMSALIERAAACSIRINKFLEREIEKLAEPLPAPPEGRG